MTLGPVPRDTVRAPVAQVTINGAVMPEILSVSVDDTNVFEASKFTVEARVSTAFPASWWGTQTQIRVKIFGGFAGQTSGLTRLLTGNVDKYSIDLDNRKITLTGRDLTSLLIDTKTAESYVNQNSGEIAVIIANKHGLTPVVTPTTTPAGTYYASDHTALALGALNHSTTEWDMLVYLAQKEGFDVFVQDTSLYFQPAQTTATPPYLITWTMGPDGVPSSNVIGLTIEHDLTQAPGVSVTILSYNSTSAQTIKAVTKAAGYNASQTAGNTQDYVYNVPNLTQASAQSLANQRFQDITRHLKTIRFSLPGDTVLTPRSVIQVSGTGTVFDTFYYPDMVSRKMDFDSGFPMTVTGKNIPPSFQQTGV
jgi:phage protein D